MSTNYINKITDTSGTTHDITEGVDTRIFRATCSTAAGTAAKVATLDDSTNYTLAAGVRVAVTFTYGNSAATPTLNVNSGGAKTIVTPTAVATLTSGNGTTYNTWGPYETVIFTYDGTYWVKGGTGYAIYNAYNLANSKGSGTVTGMTTTAGTHTAGSQTVSNGIITTNIPTKTSHLTNDSGFITSYTDTNTTYTLSNALSSHKFTETLTAGGSGSGTSTATMEFVAGTGITLTDDTTNKKITIASSITVPTITLNGSSTTSPSFYAPTSAGTSEYYLKSSGSGAPTWAAFPTIPTITLNGSATTSPSFYAPTSSGTTTQVLISQGNNKAPIWHTPSIIDEDETDEIGSWNAGDIYLDKATTAVPGLMSVADKTALDALIPTYHTSGMFVTSTGGTTKSLRIMNGASFNNATTSSGESYLSIGGNSTSTIDGTDYYKGKGAIRLYPATSYYTKIIAATNTSNQTITLPNKTGTVALTTDIPTITDTYSSTSSNGMSGKAVASALGSYLPLGGGTMTGNIIMDGLAILGKSSINDNANYIIAGLNNTDNYIYIGSSAGATAGIPVGIYGSNVTLSQAGNLTVSGKIKVQGHSTEIGEFKYSGPSSTVTVAKSTSVQVCSISLPAGTWVCTCYLRWSAAAGGIRRGNLSTASKSTALHSQITASTNYVLSQTWTNVVDTTGGTYYLNAYQSSDESLTLSATDAGYITGVRAVRIA